MHLAANSFSREISQHFDAYFQQYKLATSYVELLLLLHEHEKLSQKEIAEQMNLAPSTITRFIKKLEKKGLTGKEKDGRLVLIVLSKKGRQTVPELSKDYNRAKTDLEKKIGEKFVHTTGQLLEHGVAVIKED